MRLLLTTVALLVILFPQPSMAQTVCGPQDYDAKQAPDFDCPSPDESSMIPRLNPPPSVPVKVAENITATWDGALVHRDRLIEYGLKIKGLRRLRWADRLYIAERYLIEIEHARTTGAVREELLEEVAEYHQERATAAERAVRSANAWYRSFGFGLVVGFIGAGLLVALSVYVGTAL